MNRRITFYYTILLIIATMFTALGNYQNTYATSAFSGLFDGNLNGILNGNLNGILNSNLNGILNSNLNGTLNMLTPFNDEVDNAKSNNLKDCANCVGSYDKNPGTAAPLISNDMPDENDVGRDGGIGANNNNDNGDLSANNNNDNPNEEDVGRDGGIGANNNNDNPNEEDVGRDGGIGANNNNGDLSGGGINDNPNDEDVSGNSPFSLPFNSQFADPSDDAEGDISDKIPFP